MGDLLTRRRILRAEDRNTRDHLVKQLEFERDFLLKEAVSLGKEQDFK